MNVRETTYKQYRDIQRPLLIAHQTGRLSRSQQTQRREQRRSNKIISQHALRYQNGFGAKIDSHLSLESFDDEIRLRFTCIDKQSSYFIGSSLL